MAPLISTLLPTARPLPGSHTMTLPPLGLMPQGWQTMVPMAAAGEPLTVIWKVSCVTSEITKLPS